MMLAEMRKAEFLAAGRACKATPTLTYPRLEF